MESLKLANHHQIELINEIEQKYSNEAKVSGTRLAYLLENLICHSPESALELLARHTNHENHSLQRIHNLLPALADKLLSGCQMQLVENLLQVATEWHLPLDSRVYYRIAKAYRQHGESAKARALLYLLKNEDNCHSADVLRNLYEIAREQSQDSEAHALLGQLVSTDPSLATATFAFRERRNLAPQEGPPVRIALLSSYTLESLVPYLDFECRSAGLVPEFYVGPFNQYMQEVLQESSGLYCFRPEIIFIAVAVEDLFPAVKGYPLVEELNTAAAEIQERLRLIVDTLRERCDGIIVLHELVFTGHSPHGILDNKNPNGLARWIEDLNRALEDYVRIQKHAYLLPLRQVLGWIGKKQSYDPKMQYMASMRLNGSALPEIARHSMRYVKPLKGLTRKCVVLDLDGTLWGGIAGELGIEGIQLGPSIPGMEYLDFQEALLNLTRRGILLAVASKNNPDDVLPVIRNHPHMRLREEHFAAVRINWKNKVDNIRELADELNIGLNSLVFIDDNPHEREMIRQMLPEVLTVDLPTDPSRYRETLEAMSDFELLALTKEDEVRSAQYQAMHQRRAVRNAAASLEDYFQSLNISASIGIANLKHIDRLVQMHNKTNQFNLTTRRYQTADMTRFLADDAYQLYILNVRDRFGDHGLVGAAIIRANGNCWFIDSLLMSCRVMGLSVETALLHKIYEDAAHKGIETLVGEFIPTKQNQPVEDFYSRHGFSRMTEPERGQYWKLNVCGSKIERPSWITLTGAPGDYDS